jgi:diguanylate cyclase (GGDEF)-like protein
LAIRAANTDALTNLPNRRALDLALPAAEGDPAWAITVFDADNFKLINESAGHGAGDYVLRRMGMVIREVAAAYGYGERVFRYGGDEFVAIVPEEAARPMVAEVTLRGQALAKAVGFEFFGITGAVGRTFEEADGFLRFQKRGGKRMAANG